jgi:secreted trypsin-like serine protease
MIFKQHGGFMNTKENHTKNNNINTLLSFKKPVLQCLALWSLIGLSACAPSQHDTTHQKVSHSAHYKKIIGGTKVDASEDMSNTIVGLYDTKMKAICTGSIISESVILTAAHCVDSGAESLKIIFSNDLAAKNIIWKSVQHTQVSDYWKTRQFLDQDTGDIALLSFTGGLPPGYHPVKLLPHQNTLKIGDEVTLAGYGISNGVTGEGTFDLKKTTVQISETNFGKTEVLLDQRNGKGACHGDSGGPAYASVDGQLYLFGITSRGNDDPNNDCSHFAVYTNVLTYSNWLENTKSKIQIGHQAKK